MPEHTLAENDDNATKEPSDTTTTATSAEVVESLRDRATSAEEERDRYFDMLQRLKAEFESDRACLQNKLTKELQYAHSGLARELLPVLDNLELALDAATTRNELGALLEGLRLVQSQFLGALGRFGVIRIEALGEPFDPKMHEAVRVEPRSDLDHGTVAQVMVPGFRLHERLLRPAKVVVAQPPRD